MMNLERHPLTAAIDRLSHAQQITRAAAYGRLTQALSVVETVDADCADVCREMLTHVPATTEAEQQIADPPAEDTPSEAITGEPSVPADPSAGAEPLSDDPDVGAD